MYCCPFHKSSNFQKQPIIALGNLKLHKHKNRSTSAKLQRCQDRRQQIAFVFAFQIPKIMFSFKLKHFNSVKCLDILSCVYRSMSVMCHNKVRLFSTANIPPADMLCQVPSNYAPMDYCTLSQPDTVCCSAYQCFYFNFLFTFEQHQEGRKYSQSSKNSTSIVL